MPLSLQPPWDETISGLSGAIREKRMSCRDVWERCRAAVRRGEPQIKAWVSIDDQAATELAEQREAELKSGLWRGPLHGIPVGVKDIYDIKGQPTHAGIPNSVAAPAERDCTMVARLRNAGAIVAGKTVTTAYAFFDPPVTRNPWNLERTPGGSSSGSAAAVASDMCLGALGSQTGGSITRPASFCGIAGYKPTFGSLGRRGVFPFAPSLDHPGPMARTVDDLICLMTALAPRCLRPHFAALLNEPSIFDPDELPTFVIPEGAFAEKTEPEMLAALNSTVEAFDGATAVRIDPVELELPKLWRHHRCVMAVEIAMSQGDRLQSHLEQFTPAIKGLVEEGLAARSVDYAAAIQFQRTLRRVASHLISGTVWLMPAARGAAPTPETTGDPCMNSPWSFLGFPTLTLPMGLSPDGLPLGIQLVAGPGCDLDLFRAARWCEAMLARRNETASAAK